MKETIAKINKTKSRSFERINKISAKREADSNTILPQETRKISNKQTNLTPKRNRERRKKPQS